jgi:hypothetical protein
MSGVRSQMVMMYGQSQLNRHAAAQAVGSG